MLQGFCTPVDCSWRYSSACQAGLVLGVDLFDGILRQARRRVAGTALDEVTPLRGDVGTLRLSDLSGARPDQLHIFLGMSVFTNPEHAFANLWSLLALHGGQLFLGTALKG